MRAHSGTRRSHFCQSCASARARACVRACARARARARERERERKREREKERKRERETSYRWHTNGANGIAQSAVASNTHFRSPGSRILFKTLPPVRKSLSRQIAVPRGPAPVGKTPSSLDPMPVGRFVCSNATQPCRRRIEVAWESRKVAVGASNPHRPDDIAQIRGSIYHKYLTTDPRKG